MEIPPDEPSGGGEDRDQKNRQQCSWVSVHLLSGRPMDWPLSVCTSIAITATEVCRKCDLSRTPALRVNSSSGALSFPPAVGDPPPTNNPCDCRQLEGLSASSYRVALAVPYRGAMENPMGLQTSSSNDTEFRPQLGRSVSIEQAAQRLGVSRRTVYYRIRDLRLRTIRTIGGSLRVLTDSLEELSREVPKETV